MHAEVAKVGQRTAHVSCSPAERRHLLHRLLFVDNALKAQRYTHRAPTTKPAFCRPTINKLRRLVHHKNIGKQPCFYFATLIRCKHVTQIPDLLCYTDTVQARHTDSRSRKTKQKKKALDTFYHCSSATRRSVVGSSWSKNPPILAHAIKYAS